MNFGATPDFDSAKQRLEDRGAACDARGVGADDVTVGVATDWHVAGEASGELLARVEVEDRGDRVELDGIVPRDRDLRGADEFADARQVVEQVDVGELDRRRPTALPVSGSKGMTRCRSTMNAVGPRPPE